LELSLGESLRGKNDLKHKWVRKTDKNRNKLEQGHLAFYGRSTELETE
jgi:hypothetical protein